MYAGILLSFTFITFALSLAYLFIFFRSGERFMQYWGFAWAAYSCSLFCLLLFIHTHGTYLPEARKIFDMLNILLLLFGIFAFIHVRIPAYWYRFSLYMVLLAGICVYFQFDLFSFYLPISIFQVSITLVICYTILRYWRIPLGKKGVALVVFVVWGLGKALVSLLEFYYQPTFYLYLSEIAFSNLLNFWTLTIYIQYIRNEVGLTEWLYKTVAENASDAIFYYKLKPYPAFEYVTPSIETITGYRPADFYKDPRLYVKLTKANYLDALEDTFRGNIRHDGGQTLEIVRKDGSSFWGEIKAATIESPSDGVTAVEGILRDITALKSVQLEQIKAKQSRDLLLSYISHELRTPMTSMAGYLTALNDGMITKEEERREAMEIVTSKTMVLKKLIDDLDQLSQLETHQFSFRFMTHSVDEFVDTLLHRYLPDAGISGTAAEIHLPKHSPEHLWIAADEARIGQVFSNILDNAYKYSDGMRSPAVEFQTDGVRETFTVRITNTGSEIPPEDLPYIFDRFYRTGHPASQKLTREGRGLGLAISKEIIKAHKGDIYAESQGGKTAFTFTLPLFKEDSHVQGKDSDH